MTHITKHAVVVLANVKRWINTRITKLPVLANPRRRSFLTVTRRRRCNGDIFSTSTRVRECVREAGVRVGGGGGFWTCPCVEGRSSPERRETKTEPPSVRLTSRASAAGRRGSWCVARREKLGGGEESRLHTGVCLHELLLLLLHATDPSATDALSFHGGTVPGPRSRHWVTRMPTAPRDVRGLPRLRGRDSANQRRPARWRRSRRSRRVEARFKIFVTATFRNLHLPHVFFSVVTCHFPGF